MSNRKKKHARSWKKMLRARTNMKNRGYELEVDEFVRTELSIAGKKRTTNVWMDYVKEQTIAEEQQDQRQQQAQYAIQELRDLKRQRTALIDQKEDLATLAQDEWTKAMTFQSSYDDIAYHTPNRSKASNSTTNTLPPKIYIASSDNPHCADSLSRCA